MVLHCVEALVSASLHSNNRQLDSKMALHREEEEMHSASPTLIFNSHIKNIRKLIRQCHQSSQIIIQSGRETDPINKVTPVGTATRSVFEYRRVLLADKEHCEEICGYLCHELANQL
jgi:hypothetical protein